MWWQDESLAGAHSEGSGGATEGGGREQAQAGSCGTEGRPDAAPNVNAIAVAIISGSLGYAIGVGFMNLIGIEGSFLVWVVGIAMAALVIFVTFKWNLQKYAIIVATSVGGTLIIVGTFMFGLAGLQVAQLARNPVQHAFEDNPFWFIFAIVLVVAGIVLQIRHNRAWDIEPYENRM